MTPMFQPSRVAEWPGGADCAVMLCFDVDGETVALSEDEKYGTHGSLMSLCSYGPRIGAPRLLDLLKHYGVPATFFVPGYVAEQHPGLVERIVREGHELGLHGYLHEKLTGLDKSQEQAVLDRSLEVLERISGIRPVGHRAPWFATNDVTPEILKSRGLLYSASEMGADAPYVHPNGLVEIPLQWTLEDWEQFAFHAEPAIGFQPAEPEKVYRLWSEEFRAAADIGGCHVLTMHPFIMGRMVKVRLLERLIRDMSESGRAWFARGREVAEWALSTMADTSTKSMRK
jgi:peptidoglycan/xylan/chitin deacetylase (PgdA/CDA1 family)